MKKVCIKGNEFNTNYHLVFSEEKAIEKGYKVFEVPEGYEDCAFEDFNDDGFNVNLYNARKEREEAKREITERYEYLNKTDYIDNKLIEAYVLGDSKKLKELKEKYAEELEKREEARNYIDKFGD